MGAEDRGPAGMVELHPGLAIGPERGGAAATVKRRPLSGSWSGEQGTEDESEERLHGTEDGTPGARVSSSANLCHRAAHYRAALRCAKTAKHRPQMSRSGVA